MPLQRVRSRYICLTGRANARPLATSGGVPPTAEFIIGRALARPVGSCGLRVSASLRRKKRTSGQRQLSGRLRHPAFSSDCGHPALFALRSAQAPCRSRRDCPPDRTNNFGSRDLVHIGPWGGAVVFFATSATSIFARMDIESGNRSSKIERSNKIERRHMQRPFANLPAHKLFRRPFFVQQVDLEPCAALLVRARRSHFRKIFCVLETPLPPHRTSTAGCSSCRGP